MKKQVITDKNNHKKAQAQVPVFDNKGHDALKDHQTGAQKDTMEDKISFFDVKDLYDRAYAALDSHPEEYKTKEIMAEAIKFDMLYRCQLAQQNNYNPKSKINDFRIIQDARTQA